MYRFVLTDTAVMLIIHIIVDPIRLYEIHR